MNAPLNIAMPAEASAAPKAYRLLIDGKHVDARDGRTLERKSPGHGFTVSHYAQAGEAEVEAAVQAAGGAVPGGVVTYLSGADVDGVHLVGEFGVGLEVAAGLGE